MRGGEVVCRSDALSPIDRLKLATGVDPEDVGDIAAIDAEDVCLRIIVNRGRWGLAARGRYADEGKGGGEREGFADREFAVKSFELERGIHGAPRELCCFHCRIGLRFIRYSVRRPGAGW